MRGELLFFVLSGCVPLPDKDVVFDPDGDGAPYGEDCDNTDAAVSPNAEELPYDGVDNDCDAGTPDDDLDQDGYSAEWDCNDQLAVRNPFGSDSTADDCDQNCDGVDGTDADGDGVASLATGGTDCDDQDASTHPAVDYEADVYQNGCDPDAEPPDDITIAEEICEDGTVNGCDEGLDAALACAPNGDLQSWGASSLAGGSGDLALKLAAVGDMDGDGVPDVLVGSPGRDGEAEPGGGALILLSGAKLGSWSLEEPLLQGAESMALGDNLAAAGDQDGDGRADVLASAPGLNSVFVIGAGESGVTVVANFLGPRDSTSFGASLSPLSDLNDDGVAEILIGAPDLSGASPGLVYLFEGGAEGAVGSEGAMATLSTGAVDDLFGAVVLSADFGGDGVEDLLLGVPGDDTNGDDAGGACKLERRPEDILPDLSTCAWIRGQGVGEGLGVAAVTLDWNGDGVLELVLSASGVGDAGAAFVFEGPVDRPNGPGDAIGQLSLAGAGLGEGLSVSSDVDGDGVDELLMSFRDELGTGSAWLVYDMPDSKVELSGADRAASLKVDGYTLNRAMVSPGDLDQDGYGDLVFGLDSESGGQLIWVLGSGY